MTKGKLLGLTFANHNHPTRVTKAFIVARWDRFVHYRYVCEEVVTTMVGHENYHALLSTFEQLANTAFFFFRSEHKL